MATGKERLRRPLPEAITDPRGNSFVKNLLVFPGGDRAFTALADGTGLIWDLTPGKNPAERLVKSPGEKEITGWWNDLAVEDAARSYKAIWSFAEVPESAAVAFFRKRLKPAAAADFDKVRQLIENLDSNSFEVREKACKQLENLGQGALPALRQALKNKPSLEVRRRLETLLSQPPNLVTSPELLRRVRAIQVLERIASKDAQLILAELVGGMDFATETMEAKTALERLSRRGGTPGEE
jgi:hypothetical protein